MLFYCLEHRERMDSVDDVGRHSQPRMSSTIASSLMTYETSPRDSNDESLRSESCSSWKDAARCDSNCDKSFSWRSSPVKSCSGLTVSFLLRSVFSTSSSTLATSLRTLSATPASLLISYPPICCKRLSRSNIRDTPTAGDATAYQARPSRRPEVAKSNSLRLSPNKAIILIRQPFIRNATSNYSKEF